MTREQAQNALIRNLEMQSSYNYDSDTQGYDSDYAASNFDVAVQAPQNGRTSYLAELEGCTSYGLKITWVANPAPGIGYVVGGLPVLTTLFAGDFNTSGTVNPDGTVTFANGQGDTTIIAGLTQPYKAILSRSATNPFRIKVVRMQPLNESQFFNPIVLSKQTVFGVSSSNNITPDEYRDPYIFQTLKVDVPVKYPVGADSGLSLLVNPSEKIGMTLFIDLAIDHDKILTGQSQLRGQTATINKIANGTHSNRPGHNTAKAHLTPHSAPTHLAGAGHPAQIINPNGSATVHPAIAAHPAVQAAIKAASYDYGM
jgi:hypothetical protein